MAAVTGITFGNRHTWTDFGLSLDGCPMIGEPEVNEKYLDVPGGVPIDVSTYPAGYVTYKTRPFSCRLVKLRKTEEWPVTISALENYLHGKRMDMILDEDLPWKYNGRFKVHPVEINGITALEVTGTLLPYKEFRRDLKDPWVWDNTNFAEDENLVDDGWTNIAIGQDSALTRFFLPDSVCRPKVTVTLNVTGFYGGATSGSTGISASSIMQIAEPGTYVNEGIVSLSNVNVYVSNLVGTITISHKPRSF